MEQYITYEYYERAFGGTSIPEEVFDKLAIESSFYVNQCCFDKITDKELSDEDLGDRIKRATCAVADISFGVSERDGIQSEGVGNVSITYRNMDVGQVHADKYFAVSMYLGSTGLMYRGML